MVGLELVRLAVRMKVLGLAGQESIYGELGGSEMVETRLEIRMGADDLGSGISYS